MYNGSSGGGGGNGGLAASVVANLAAAIKTLSFDATEAGGARLQALTSAVLSIGAAAPEKEPGGCLGTVRQQCLQVTQYLSGHQPH